MNPINPNKTTSMQRKHLRATMVAPWLVARNSKPLKLPPDLARAKKKIDALARKHKAKENARYEVIRKAHEKATTAILFAPPAEALAAVEAYNAVCAAYRKK